jgi:hypothetical protein
MDAFVDAAKRFQDVVGEHQDAVVAEDQLSSVASRLKTPEAVFVAGRLLERQSLRRRGARSSLPKAWRKLERRGRRI